MENQVLISARGLTRRYGAMLAVDDLNLTLHQGEILGLLGPNGAGKSTTMKMLTGNLAPSAGDVQINGMSMRENPKAAKQFLGYLPEQPPVYPELTVDEYLRYCAGLHGVAPGARAAALDSAKRDCGLSHVGHRLVGNLSKGYQQRVGIAQAIIHRPPVVILDEPTVGLDPIQILEIRNLIKSLGQNHSVILSSHILPEIQAVCSRVMIIAHGQAVYNEPVEATRDQALTALTLGLLRAPKVDAITAIAGVKSARDLGNGRFAIEVAAGADPREALADASARGDWGLIELAAQTRTLEDIFVALTSSDVSNNMKEAA
ncbi:ABC transporter ATP-binding protein [Sinimarinibacterium sp. NLF-5-8]|uniref:ABC transporter ATP-binding protein n=1 Tax=Sinimarinibacterium sp. NLF-5-8 TaxID=2698684 RepID=UPI00137BDCC6|nr:ABC transporter ATP-binding protein [Sinimarinibacterium sp. NLF-5-8]QHS11279.1 ATP-binding cassette domain-containing protein [Sinimarinibacterium sp. NLF-5-8]